MAPVFELKAPRDRKHTPQPFLVLDIIGFKGMPTSSNNATTTNNPTDETTSSWMSLSSTFKGYQG